MSKKKKWTSKDNVLDAFSFILLMLIFATGFYVGNNMTTNIFVDNPLYENFVPKGVSDWDMISYSSYVPNSNMKIIELPPEFIFSSVLGSQSMFPLVSSTNHTLILKTGVILTDVNIGDVISYSEVEGSSVIHRIIGLYSDEKGRYARVQGDNNKEPDDIKVRSEMINGVLVGVLY